MGWPHQEGILLVNEVVQPLRSGDSVQPCQPGGFQPCRPGGNPLTGEVVQPRQPGGFLTGLFFFERKKNFFLKEKKNNEWGCPIGPMPGSYGTEAVPKCICIHMRAGLHASLHSVDWLVGPHTNLLWCAGVHTNPHLACMRGAGMRLSSPHWILIRKIQKRAKNQYINQCDINQVPH
jgi:hypothetical protein